MRKMTWLNFAYRTDGMIMILQGCKFRLNRILFLTFTSNYVGCLHATCANSSRNKIKLGQTENKHEYFDSDQEIYVRIIWINAGITVVAVNRLNLWWI